MTVAATISLKPRLYLRAGLCLLGLLFVTQVVLVAERRAAGREADNRLEKKRKEFRVLAATVPALTIENSAAIQTDLVRTEAVLRAVESALNARGPAAERWQSAVVPAKRTDAFFDLAAFVEKARERAAAAGVGLKPAERFSFLAYANEGPDPALIPAVFRQRLVVEHLLDAVFRAGTRQLLAIERERPLPPGGRGGASLPVESSITGIFQIDPRSSLRASGAIQAQAFRVVFLGQTADLRAFVNRLGDFELPLIIRSIEVEPGGTSDPTRNEASRNHSAVNVASAGIDPRLSVEGSMAVVVPSLLKFSVTVELIELVPADGGGKPKASTASVPPS